MQTRKQVVVLGAGYAGLMAAVRLWKKAGKRAAITLVNGADEFHERTRHHQLATGQALRPQPLAAFVRGTGIRLERGWVTGLDLAARRVSVDTDGGAKVLDYDYLINALGSVVAVGDVPGAREHAFSPDRASALRLAERLPALRARGRRVLIVGGGNTGVEVATELAESHPGLNITLATRRSFARNLSRGAQAHIRRAFERLKIDLQEHTEITRVKADRAFTATGGALPFDTCVWVGGFGVSDLARRAGLAVNAAGQILIDPAMRSVSHPEVYAVGDAAHPVEPPGAPLRMGLYSSIMMGGHGADCLADALRGRPSRPFGLSYLALGVSLGRRDGAWQFLNWDRDTPLNLIVTGYAANLMREFFVRFAVWVIHAQRAAPWVFEWPGRRKRWGAAFTTKDEPPGGGRRRGTEQAGA